MERETAMIVFRHRDDDYSLWMVDLPSEMVQKARQAEQAIHGELEDILTGIPLSSEETKTKLNFLFQEEDGFSLRPKSVEPSIVEEYRNEGCSVRGEKEYIMSVVEDLFPKQAPNLGMTF